MKFARVIGNVVSTQKDAGISGRKLLVIQPLDLNLKPSGDYLIAIDAVGAGDDEIVLFASGSSARQTTQTKDTPCDCVIMGIIDLIESGGKTIFRKSQEM